MATTLTLNVNGKDYPNIQVSDSSMPLLWVLRDILGLTGTKYGCGIEVCGACTVIIDGQREHSCVFDVSSAVGKKILTIEGLTRPDGSIGDAAGAAVQKAWIDNQVPQCGYCQPGMIMGATASIKAGKHGSSIASDLIGKHICVCGTYQRIKNAAKNL